MAEWKRVRLGDVADYVREKSPCAVATPTNYISTENMLPNKGGVVESSALPLTGSITAFKVGDILLSNIRPYFKKIWQANKSGFSSNDVLVIRANEHVASKYLFSVLSSDAFFEFVMAGAKGTKMPRGDKQQILEYHISLPPLPTQRKIAAVLGAIDDKIETNRKICANLEAQAQALFKSWFVDFEPFGGKMPKDWKVGTLGNVFVFKRGTAISKKDVSEVRDIENKFVVYGAGRDVFGYSSKATIHEPSVLITAIGAGSGDVSRTHELSYSVTSNAFYVTPKVPSDFPYAYLRLKNFDFHLHCSGSAQPMLAYGAFENESIEAPTNKIINEFCKVVGPLLEMYDCSLAGINRLASMRDALLPKLMSGEIDVEKVEVA